MYVSPTKKTFLYLWYSPFYLSHLYISIVCCIKSIELLYQVLWKRTHSTLFFLITSPFNEQMKFKLTCRDFYSLHYTENELERLSKLIPGTLDSSYKDANESLKSDIRKLLKYYKLEMACRKRDVEFTALIFVNWFMVPCSLVNWFVNKPYILTISLTINYILVKILLLLKTRLTMPWMSPFSSNIFEYFQVRALRLQTTSPIVEKCLLISACIHDFFQASRTWKNTMLHWCINS